MYNSGTYECQTMSYTTLGKDKAYQGREDILQIEVAKVLDFKKLLWIHVANERQTSPMRGAKLKKMGVKPGVPDILILETRPRIAIELKAGRGRVGGNQDKFLKELTLAGWDCYVCYNLDSVLQVLKKYNI